MITLATFSPTAFSRMVPARPEAIGGISFLATLAIAGMTLPASDGTYTPGKPVNEPFAGLAQPFLDKHCL